jgi:hypothetical protein
MPAAAHARMDRSEGRGPLTHPAQL